MAIEKGYSPKTPRQEAPRILETSQKHPKRARQKFFYFLVFGIGVGYGGQDKISWLDGTLNIKARFEVRVRYVRCTNFLVLIPTFRVMYHVPIKNMKI